MTFRYNALYNDLLLDLSDSVPGVDFESCPDDWPGITLRQRRATALRTSFFKKLKDGSTDAGDAVALEKFLSSNSRCGLWEFAPNTSLDEALLGQFRKELGDAFESGALAHWEWDHHLLFSRGRTGPGASLGARGGDFYTKLFSSPLKATCDGLVSMFDDSLRYYPNWGAAERQRASQFCGPDIVAGNRLSFVPKNVTESRPICTEPSLNMFYQLGMGSVMNSLLMRKYRIDLSVQQLYNRELARVGSANDSLVTIDLSSASDSVSLRMLEWALPRNVVAWLRLLRSPKCELPNGNSVELEMISSMGNGFTFSLETLIFASVVSAVYKLGNTKLVQTSVQHLRNKGQASSQEVWAHGNFGVFGDDIIVEQWARERVVRLLELLGFQVNADKSFYQGPFRESCGGDYFNGHDVRGVYIKSLSSPTSRFVAINRLNEWSAAMDIPLPRVIPRLVKAAPKYWVPLHENDDAGIKCPLEYAAETPQAKRISSVSELHGAVRYRRWIPKVHGAKVTESRVITPRGTKGRIYNPEGLLLAYLRGDIRNCTISLRHSEAKYRTKEDITPNWDWCPTVGKQFPIGSGQLATAIKRNLPQKG